MKKYEIQIEGVTDMLINKFSHELNKEKTSVAKDKLVEWEEKNWKKKAYINDDVEPFMPDVYITGSLRNGAYSSGLQLSKKKGKKTISKAFIDGNSLIDNTKPLIKISSEIIPFSTNVKINKATITTIRPLFSAGWKCNFQIVDLNESFTLEEIERLFNYCGKYIGVGDWRPKYGRFKINKIKEVN